MKKLISLVAGLTFAVVNTLPNVALAKYECTGIDNIIGQTLLTPIVQRFHRDLNGDGKADITGLYVFDECWRKLRENKYDSESKEESWERDSKSVGEYIDSK